MLEPAVELEFVLAGKLQCQDGDVRAGQQRHLVTRTEQAADRLNEAVCVQVQAAAGGDLRHLQHLVGEPAVELDALRQRLVENGPRRDTDVATAGHDPGLVGEQAAGR